MGDDPGLAGWTGVISGVFLRERQSGEEGGCWATGFEGGGKRAQAKASKQAGSEAGRARGRASG